MSDWLTALDLTGITLFCQDWGGLIGLRLVAAFPDRFARLVVVQYRTAGRHRLVRRVRRLAGVQPERAAIPGRLHRQRRQHARPDARPRSPPMTRPSPTKATRKARASSRRWCRSRPNMPRSRRTAPRGRCWSRFDKPVLTAFGEQGRGDQRRREARSSSGCPARGPAAPDHRGRRPFPAGGCARRALRR